MWWCLCRPGDEWYLCRLTLSMPSQANLQWAMFPSPYLGSVGPDATPGSVVYRLSARQRDGTQEQTYFILLDGEWCTHTVFIYWSDSLIFWIVSFTFRCFITEWKLINHVYWSERQSLLFTCEYSLELSCSFETEPMWFSLKALSPVRHTSSHPPSPFSLYLP